VNLGKGADARYNEYDTLAKADDLLALFDLLSCFKGSNVRFPIFTAVSVVANPDFERIKKNDFSDYYWESFIQTLIKYGQRDAWDLWQEGEAKHLFRPEFHGREHLNVTAWLRSLQQADSDTIAAFEEGCWGFKPTGVNFQAAFELENHQDLTAQFSVIKEGLEEFTQIHQRRARFFVPPNGPFNNRLEAEAAAGGIKVYVGNKNPTRALRGGEV
jgi:hypothetical protein